jgi:hypothetical protein
MRTANLLLGLKGLLIFLLIGCVAPLRGDQDVVFFESDGVQRLTPSTVSTMYKEKMGSDFSPITVVVATKDTSNKLFQTQMETIYGIDIEEVEQLQLIIVEANEKSINGQIYHTSKAQAKKLLKGRSFLLVIYDSNGKIRESRTVPINKEDLIALANGIRSPR